MKLRTRTLMIIGTALPILFFVLYLASSSILLKGFARLEQSETQFHIERSQKTIDGLLASLALHCRDWSNWDDTYVFVKRGNKDYIRSNLLATTFPQLDVDLFLYFRREGSLFAGFQHTRDNTVISPSESYLTAFRRNRHLIDVPENIPSVTGVVLVKGRPMLVAAAPILTSESKGPSRGTLLIGRYLTKERLQSAAKAAGLALSLIPTGQGPPLSSAHPTMVRIEGEDAIAGYALLTDPGGRKVAVLKVNTRRWIFRQGKASQYFLMLNLAAAGIVFVAVVLVLLHRLILSRLALMDKSVALIRKDGDLNVRLPVKGDDELENLAATINEALETLQKAQQELHHDALHDPLTGLANRALFFQRVEAAMQRRNGTSSPTCAVLMIDIDHFKLINDSFGHLAGDELLTLAARRLGRFFGGDDTIARLGGDEFAILLDPVKDEKEALRKANGFLTSLQKPVVWQGHLLHLGASVGVMLFRPGYSSAEQLLRDADTAMYHAKREGRNCAVLFDDAMREQVKTHLTLQNQLRGAAERGELRLCYQPMLALDSGTIHSFEALIRWDHPEFGTLSPDRFIPLAESGGFMARIDTWVFREACRSMLRWQKLFGAQKSVQVSVNISCLHGQLLQVMAELRHILEETGLDGHCIGLEITENALAVAKQDFVESLHALKSLGVRLYLDDFGTGHSSLSRLHQLPFDVLKIDRSFISELESGNGEITRSIVTLAHGLGMLVVAEGIESKAQLARLVGHGCDFGQGYLFAKPLTAEEAENFLQRQFDGGAAGRYPEVIF